MATKDTRLEQEPDGSVTAYDDIPVDGDRVERLLVEVFTRYWDRITLGPVIEGAAWEIRLAAKPALSMADGYLTVDAGAWHAHLCVGPAAGDDLARRRRVGRAAFFRTAGGTCVPESYGLRLWNGRGEQMVTIFFPNPYYDDQGRRLPAPDPARTGTWEALRRRWGGAEAPRADARAGGPA